MGYFDGVGKGELTTRNKFLKEGIYTLEVDNVLIKKVRATKTDAFIAECLITETSNPEEHPVGSKTSVYIDLANDSAKNNLKAFGLAVLGVDRNDAARVAKVCDGETPIIEAALSDALLKSAFKGKKFRVDAVKGTNKKGEPTTYMNYSPIAKAAA